MTLSASDGEAPVLEIWEVWMTLTLRLIPTPVHRECSMSQMDMFDN